VFLHPTEAAALRAYDRARDEAFPEAAATFLVNSRGGPLDGRNTSKTFAVLVTTTGIKAPPGQRARLWPPSRRLTRRVRMAMPAAVSANPGT